MASLLGLAAQDPKSHPIAPEEAPSRMTLPEGFRASLFAGEPDVVQPMAFTFDDRGRLWVVECLSYPQWLPPGQEGHDRIVIFDDPDGKGRFKTKKVFHDRLSNVSGLEVGFGGVWVCSTPHLLFIPDRDQDDVPDGPPEVVLDGWNLQKAQHNVFNHLEWGPDGWLYGLNGIQSDSRVGKPGTPDEKRVPLNCAVWRYHPSRGFFQVVAHGTTNPWGLDWDDWGQMFITNCVIKHLWHVIPGAHFQRMYGQDLVPNLYGLMESCADHIHWAGGKWQDARGQAQHSEYGGGHAHVGAMVYLGDNWPDRYRNTLFTNNLHGNRVVNDLLEFRGSGYVAHHGKDFLLANDPWFRGLDVKGGPDGGVFVSDWTDTGECHNYKVVDRTNGRIYKITYGEAKPVRPDLARQDDAQLVGLQLHKNDWFVRHARRLLQERALSGKLSPQAAEALRGVLRENPDVTRRLRALWALYSIGACEEPLLVELLDHPSDHLRRWAIQLSCDLGVPAEPAISKMTQMAQKDSSPIVRLALASALQRLPLAQRWALAEGLVGHEEDAEDQNLPLMIWYGIEPLVELDKARALGLMSRAKIPLLRQYITRRVAALSK
jgi:putative membrane-bound dehydrogenase-like protein